MIGKQGVYAEALKNKYRDMNWFNMKGFTPREEVMQMYTQADIVCFPSWWENFPMVCLEAMSQGAIVVGSNSGGMSEIIEDNKSGFLIEPHNTSSLAAKISQILQLSEEERFSISKNAKQRIKKVFNMETIMKQQISYYREVINDYKQQKYD